MSYRRILREDSALVIIYWTGGDEQSLKRGLFNKAKGAGLKSGISALSLPLINQKVLKLGIKRSFFIVLSLVVWLSSFGQSVKESEVWPQYYVQFPIDKKFTVTADYSHRYSEDFERKTQWIGRAGLGYSFNRTVSASAGYAYSEFFSPGGVRTEHRPWQQLQTDNSFKRIKVVQRLRLEERFQKDRSAERFNYRLRYQVHLAYPLLSRQRLQLQVADEPMLNAGRQVSGNRFDQNRLQAGLQIKLAENVFLIPAYMYIYQYQASRKDFRNVNVFRAGLSYRKQR